MLILKRHPLAAIIGLALLLRLAAVLAIPPLDFGDEELYELMARNLLSGAGLNYGPEFQAFRPPLFPLVLAVIHGLGGGLLAVRLFNALAGTLTVYLVYRLGREMFDRPTAWLAALAAAAWPFFIFYTALYLTESLYVLLVVAATLYLVRLARGADRPADGAAAGGLLGLSLLCRPTLLAFAPAALLLIGRPRRCRRAAVTAALACLLVLAPWIVRNWVVLGAFVPGTTMGGRVFYEGNNPHSAGGPCQVFPAEVEALPEIARDRAYYRRTLAIIREDPERFGRLLGMKFRRFWALVPNAPGFQAGRYRLISLAAMLPTLPLFLLGLAVSYRRRGFFLLAGQILYATVFHMIFLASIRYRLPVEPFYLLFAAAGLRRLYRPRLTTKL